MKIAVRVDTNKEVATGHVMRCMAVTSALLKLGVEVTVISADDGVCPYVDDVADVATEIPEHNRYGVAKGDPEDTVYADRRLHTCILCTDWSDMDSELRPLIGYLHEREIDVMLVDSYRITPGYFDALAEAGINVAYMDDLGEYPYHVGTLINYRPDADQAEYMMLYETETVPQFCLGAKYAPLRSQFAVGNPDGTGYTDGPSTSAARDRGYNILLTTGGSDTLGITDMILRKLIHDFNAIIHILAGRYFTPSAYLREAIDSGRVILHQNVSDVAGLMSGCDAAISSAGSTLLELCALGVPAVTFTFADNQLPNARFFDSRNIFPYAGDFRDDADRCPDRIADQLAGILNMSERDRAAAAARMRSVTDGHGAERIAEVLMSM